MRALCSTLALALCNQGHSALKHKHFAMYDRLLHVVFSCYSTVLSSYPTFAVYEEKSPSEMKWFTNPVEVLRL